MIPALRTSRRNGLSRMRPLRVWNRRPPLYKGGKRHLVTLVKPRLRR
jgi:hypothetical protein